MLSFALLRFSFLLIVELLESQIISEAEAFDPRVLGGVFHPFFWINAGAAAVVHVNGRLNVTRFSQSATRQERELDFPSCNLPLRISQGAREPRPPPPSTKRAGEPTATRWRHVQLCSRPSSSHTAAVVMTTERLISWRTERERDWGGEGGGASTGVCL